MGKQSRNKKKAHFDNVPGFEQAESSIGSLQSPFLKDRVSAYLQSAGSLLEQLNVDQNGSVKKALNHYGKQARLLDMILSIAGASGYLPAQDKIAAEKIRQSVERRLDSGLRRRDGIVFVSNDESLKTETQSVLGRRVASLFSRIVPPTARDQPMSGAARPAWLPKSDSDRLESVLTKAKAAEKSGQISEAEELYNQALAIDRKNADAIYGLGKIYKISFNIGPAIRYLKEAYYLRPRDKDLLNHLGKALIENRQYDEAIEKIGEALQLEPDNVESLAELSNAYVYKGSDDKAMELLQRALKLAPNSPDLLVRIGAYHEMHGETEKASLHYARAIKLMPNFTPALAAMGYLLSQQHKAGQGLALINKALAIQPYNIDFLCLKSFILRAMGDYAEGWALYEHGLKMPKWRRDDLLPNKPVWKGEPMPGQSLMLMGEQGLGDVLHFVRYAALCKQRAKKVYVVCHKTLVRLLKNCPYIDDVFVSIPRWKFDKQISMLSLPHVFQTTLDTIPAQIPYLFVPDNLRKKWGHKLGFSADDKRLKVGLVWSGSMFKNTLRGELVAGRRNIKLEQLLPWFDFENILFCNLQLENGIQEIDRLGLRNRFADGMASVKDMMDTAAIIQNLDLVIAVDTSTAHLAGALGKPVWILSRYDADWRWLMNRSDNLWYPTARIFGQPKMGDWDSVVQDVRAALEERLKDSHIKDEALALPA